VKKPLNPILGEHFTCKWKFDDGSESLYIAEQVSHHPPMSAYFYMNPEHHIRIDGLLKPRSKFLGNRYIANSAQGIDDYQRGNNYGRQSRPYFIES